MGDQQAWAASMSVGIITIIWVERLEGSGNRRWVIRTVVESSTLSLGCPLGCLHRRWVSSLHPSNCHWVSAPLLGELARGWCSKLVAAPPMSMQCDVAARYTCQGMLKWPDMWQWHVPGAHFAGVAVGEYGEWSIIGCSSFATIPCRSPYTRASSSSLQPHCQNVIGFEVAHIPWWGEGMEVAVTLYTFILRLLKP